ncbi:MAG: hypothetical protein A4E19_08570 [Nitrospira sp. SG-bin1]|nr:MAG: hypothetical protein A4E19_08570 [Nitrospira sp. SG-bin1]
MTTAGEGVNKSPVFRRHGHACWDIGFTDSFNPFYLFSKLNAGLLLWAPAAPTMRQEHPLLIALEAERWMFMSRTTPAEPGIKSSLTQTSSSRIASLTIDNRLTDLQIARPQFVEAHGFFTVGGR